MEKRLEKKFTPIIDKIRKELDGQVYGRLNALTFNELKVLLAAFDCSIEQIEDKVAAYFNLKKPERARKKGVK